LVSIGIALGNVGRKDTACAKFTEALAIIGPLAEVALDNQKIQQDLVNIQHDIAHANCPA
jgi:cob(I)alamin adenosyltransferase